MTVVDKSTALPAVSISFAVALLVGAIWVGRFMAEKEGDHTAMTVVHDAMDQVAARNTRRFNSYSGKDGSNTTDIEALKEEMDALKLWLTEELGTRPR